MASDSGRHAYAGAVIAAVNDERVKALVYVAGLAPDEGETVAEVFYRDEKHSQSPQLAPMLTVSSGCRTRVGNAFHSTQRQNRLHCRQLSRGDLTEMHSGAGSNTGVEIKPSWYLIAEEDRMITRDTTLHGEEDGSNDEVALRGSHTAAQRPAESCGHHHRSK